MPVALDVASQARLTSIPVAAQPYHDLMIREARTFGVPIDLIAAVIHIESGYTPSALGAAGEVGLMQIKRETAAMLGFRGTVAELAVPEINIHFGVRYLAKAWQLADGDLCRTLIKFRAGHGEERETPRSTRYCQRARAYLADHGMAYPPNGSHAAGSSRAFARATSRRVADLAPRRGTLEATQLFWAAHNARVRQLRIAVRAKWARLATVARRP